MRVADIFNRPKLVWVGLGVLLLAAVGCNSSRGAGGDPSPTAAPATTSALRPTLSNPVSHTASPTAQPSRATSSPTLALPTDTTVPTPIPTETPSPEPTHTPTLTPSPTATPTPELRRLTGGGCCTQPFWSPDSQWVYFIDKPDADAPLGYWGVDITQAGAAPELVTERIAFYTGDLSYVVVYGQGQSAIEQLDGPLGDTVVDRWTIPANGRPFSISPGGTRVAWSISNDDLPFERRVSEIWIANFDGTDARSVATLPRGGLSGWISDDVLLLSKRESLDSRETIVYTLSLVDGAAVELVRANRPRGYWLSPDRRWMLYYVTFSDDPLQNGVWLVRTDGTERRHLDRELFGDYAWRDARRLLIIPFRPDAVHHELWEYDVETEEVLQVTDSDVTPFKVANADWQVSPDGRRIAYVESSDRNIWLLTLGD